jgi:hypothetical protein
MTYLDVSPMIVALRVAPEEFEIKEGWLRHIPSMHDFEFSKTGNVRIRAHCNCAMLSIKGEQESQLNEQYLEWQRLYWRPLLINREFAAHFRRSRARQLLINFVAWLHRKVLEDRHVHPRSEQLGAMSPAE